MNADWKTQKDAFTRYGWPRAPPKSGSADSYLYKMENALAGGDDWLVDKRFDRGYRHDPLR